MRYEYQVSYQVVNPDGSEAFGHAAVTFDVPINNKQIITNVSTVIREKVLPPPPPWGWPGGQLPSIVIQNLILLRQWDNTWRPSTSFGAVPSGSMVL